MRKLYFIAALLSGPAAYAQTNFQPGYVVQLAGDTVRGEVDYRDVRFNGRQCRFRATPAAPVTTFAPTELKAYGLRSGQHLYRALPLPGLPAQGAGVPTYFLEVLVSGPATLYNWREDSGTDHYYVATAAFPLAELVQRKVLLEEERRLQTQNLYRNTLAQALAGCPAAQATLPALPFTPRALAQAVATYNVVCQGSATAQPLAAPIQRQRQPVRFGVIIGGEGATTHFEGEAAIFSTQSNVVLGPSGSVVGGLTVNLPLTVLSTKLSLETELLYESQSYKQQYGSSNNGTYTNYQFAMAYAKLPVLVRYTFPTGLVRPLVEAGPTLGYALKLKTETYLTDNSGKATAPTDFLADSHRRFQESIMAGIGLQFSYWQGRRATLLARYERDTGWGSGIYFKTYATHFYGLLAFDLSK